MGKVILTVVMVFFMSLSLYINIFFQDNENEQDQAERAIKNAAKVLQSHYDYGDNQWGQDLEDIIVDENALVSDFEECLFENYKNYDVFARAKNNIRAKVLVYPEYFIIAGVDNVWSQPYYFWKESPGGEQVFLNTVNDYAFYFDEFQQQINVDLDELGLTSATKQDFIIDRLNGIIGAYTYQGGDLLNVKIRNPYNEDRDYKRKMQSFNVLDGLTFFAVYDGVDRFGVMERLFEVRNSEVVGYTLYIE